MDRSYGGIRLLALLSFLALSLSAGAQATTGNFEDFLKSFRSAARKGDRAALENMVRFPLPTAVDPRGLPEGDPVEPIARKDFKKYFAGIFHQDLRRLIAAAGKDALGVVGASDGSYYAALQKMADQRTILYELYLQYGQEGGNSESYFGLIFGQVSRRYRLIGYYAKWPVR